jgi:hypothetical protein
MSFFHCLYLGHFEHDGDAIRFTSTPTDPILRPVVRRPLNLEELKCITEEAALSVPGQRLFPGDWEMWVEDGYLVCNRYALSREAIDFIHRLVQVTGCELVDFNARAAISPEELMPTRLSPPAASR